MDETIEQYIAEQEGEPIQHGSQFVLDEATKLPPSRRKPFLCLYFDNAIFVSFYREEEIRMGRSHRDSFLISSLISS
jgi:hypothetical protein